MKRFFFLLCLLHCAAASAWTLDDGGGKALRLSDYRGKWVLVNFWASWCAPCLAEIPVLERLYASGRLEVVGVAVSYNSRAEVLDSAKQNAITYPVVLGNEDIAADFGGLDGLPSSFLYAPDGRLAWEHLGPLSEKALLAAMKGDGQSLGR